MSSSSEIYNFPEGSVDSGNVVRGGINGDWDGSMQRALKIANYAKECLGKNKVISSQKRSRKKTASGNVSDHWEDNLSAYAVDIPVKGNKGDELLKCIMSKFDNGSHSSYDGGEWLNVNIDGYRYQFGWKVKDHYDHIHIGVKKITSSTGKPIETKSKVFDVSKLDKMAQKNLDDLVLKMEERGVPNPKTKIIDFLNKSNVGSKYKSFDELRSSDEYKKMMKYLETRGINEDLQKMKDLMKKIL